MTINKRLIRKGMKNAVKAFHKLGYNGICDLHPSVEEAFNLLDECILDLKEGLGYKRNGDWEKTDGQ